MRVLLVFQSELLTILELLERFGGCRTSTPRDVVNVLECADNRGATCDVSHGCLHAAHVTRVREGARSLFVRHLACAVEFDPDVLAVDVPRVAIEVEAAERVRLGPGDGHLVLGLTVAAVRDGTCRGLTQVDHRESGHDRCREGNLPVERLLEDVPGEALREEVAHVGDVTEGTDAFLGIEEELHEFRGLAHGMRVDLEDDLCQHRNEYIECVQTQGHLRDVGVEPCHGVVVQLVDYEDGLIAAVEHDVVPAVHELREVEVGMTAIFDRHVRRLDHERVLAVVDHFEYTLAVFDAEAPEDGVLVVGRDLVVVATGTGLVLTARGLGFGENVGRHAVEELLLELVDHPDQVGPEGREPRQLGHREGDVLLVRGQCAILVCPTIRGVRVVDGDQDQVVAGGLVVQGQRDLHRRRQLAARRDAGDVPLLGRSLVVLERRRDRALCRFGLELGRYCRSAGGDVGAGVVLADDPGVLGGNRLGRRLLACEDTRVR